MNNGGEFRLELKIRNALILRRMEAVGIRSLQELATLAGLDKSGYHNLTRIVALKLSVVKGSTWRPELVAVSRVLECSPGDLVSQAIVDRDIGLSSTAAVDLPAESVVPLIGLLRRQLRSGSESAPDSKLLVRECREEVAAQLATLKPSEQQVLRLRFGLEGEDEHTLAEVARVRGVTPERIRQIESMALRKLRHPKRAKRLRGLVEPAMGIRRKD